MLDNYIDNVLAEFDDEANGIKKNKVNSSEKHFVKRVVQMFGERNKKRVIKFIRRNLYEEKEAMYSTNVGGTYHFKLNIDGKETRIVYRIQGGGWVVLVTVTPPQDYKREHKNTKNRMKMNGNKGIITKKGKR